MKDLLQKSLYSRYACRSFDKAKKISKEDLTLLASTIHLAPSSMGLEPCRAIFVSDEKKKAELAAFSHTQKPILDCSTLLVLMNQKPHTLSAKQVKEHYLINGKDNHQAEEKAKMLDSLLASRFNHESKLIMGYMREQVYLAMGDMIRVATLMGIDSLIIGGFDAQKTEEYLNQYPDTFTQYFMPCVFVALGYGDGEVTAKQRLPFDDIITWM